MFYVSLYQGLILDLRGNPGGLLTSAVDVASLLVPKGSEIVSAKGRGFPGKLQNCIGAAFHNILFSDI
jgi:C-terminal processing protease CtpA/Prc